MIPLSVCVRLLHLKMSDSYPVLQPEPRDPENFLEHLPDQHDC